MDSTSPASENGAAGADPLAYEFAGDIEALAGVVSGIMAVSEHG